MEAKDFLEKNGFEYNIAGDNWCNNNCDVKIHKDFYSILAYGKEFGEDCFMYSRDLNIYWLIGVLTYYGLIDKNYKQ